MRSASNAAIPLRKAALCLRKENAYDRMKAFAESLEILSRRKHLGFLQQEKRLPIIQTNKITLNFC